MAKWYFYVHGTLTPTANTALSGLQFVVRSGGYSSNTGQGEPLEPATVPGFHVHVDAEAGDEAKRMLSKALTDAGVPFTIAIGPKLYDDDPKGP